MDCQEISNSFVITFCLLVEKLGIELTKNSKWSELQRKICDFSLLTLQFHIYWHQVPFWACSPCPFGVPCSQRCWGSEHMVPHPWFQSNECCCPPVKEDGFNVVLKFVSIKLFKQFQLCAATIMLDLTTEHLPFHRGKQHWCLDHRMAGALHCWCPSH